MHKASRVLAAKDVPLSYACRRCPPRCGLLLSSPPPYLRGASAAPLTTSTFPAVAALQTAVRLQHTAAAGASAHNTTADADAAAATPQSPAEGNGALHVDPRRLPNTIPGISQEELAARITAYHTKKSQEASAFSSQALAQDVELMRRSLSPNDFEEYMTKVEQDMAAAAKEQAKLAAMSPLELHHYQMKKRRQAVRYEWYKSGMMLFALLGSTALLFSMFVFFK